MEGVGDEFINIRKNLSHEVAFGIEKAQDYLTLVSKPKLSTSLDPSKKLGCRSSDLRPDV